jgi:hypothetical protein
VRISFEDDGAVRAWLAPDPPGLSVGSADLAAGGAALAPVPLGDPMALGWATWSAAAKIRSGAPVDADEQVRRLRALGYLR